MVFPDRIGALIAKIEGGQPVTQQDVDRMAALQLLDIAKIGEDFARDSIAREEKRTADMAAAWADQDKSLSEITP